MKIVVDMNLSPTWVRFLRDAGFEAVHWSSVGSPRATDAVIMEWARPGGYIVFTHDLGFSALLAATAAMGPSVVQFRTQDVLPEAIGGRVVHVLTTHQEALERGAIISVDMISSRIRVLPIRSRPR